MCSNQESFVPFPYAPTPEDVLLWLCFDGLQLKNLPQIRQTIQASIQKQINISSEITDSFLLSATEILSNLIQHPSHTTSYIGLTLYTETRVNEKTLILNISDNTDSIPEFKTKCSHSCNNVQNHLLEDEVGRGMGIISATMDIFNYCTAQNSEDNLNHIIIGKKITQPQKAIPTIEKNSARKKEHTIFIIDDDPILRKMLNTLLSEHYNTHIFVSGHDALKAFEETPPDLILSDLIMPGMDGTELRKTLSSKKHGDTTPFIFLSGHPQEAEKQYINRLGIDGFLSKSIENKKLLQVLERTLYRSKQIKRNIQEDIDKSITNALSPSIPPCIKNWSFAIEQDIAETGGGDFILHHETKDGILLIIADVMGHGLSAKFFAYAYVGYLRGLVHLYFENHLQPSALLRMLSKRVYEDSFLENCIFTCQIIHLQPDGTIDISSAGHPWPALSSLKNTEFIEISGPLPGMVPNVNYRSVIHKMEKNEYLSLYTDGVLENISKTDHKKDQKLLQQNIQNCVHIPHVHDMTKQLWNQQKKYFQVPYRDDATLLSIQYTPDNSVQKEL